MKSNIFIPKQINIGFQNRSDTYTKKLAYIIYFDEKGKLRKENSWNSWRDKKIDNIIFDNEPTEGFVLNKKAGGYSTGWSHRQTYVRVYDQRGFEFEISVPNLLYILENTNSIKGKGLEGQFIYGWDGQDLLLIPTSSPDYIELSKLNDLRYECKKYEGKDLILGATYKDTNNHNLVYMGRYYEANKDKKETKTYFFYDIKGDKFTTIKNLNKTIIDTTDEKCIENYADLMDKLKEYSCYSERDPKKDKYNDYTLEEFELKFNKDSYYWGFDIFTKEINNELQKLQIKENRKYSWSYSYNKNKTYDVYTYYRGNRDEECLSDVTPKTIFDKYKPKYLVSYKSNGELIKEWK